MMHMDPKNVKTDFHGNAPRVLCLAIYTKYILPTYGWFPCTVTYSCVTVLFYCLFYYLQNLLHPNNEVRCYALHYIYLYTCINHSLNVFKDCWNHHGVHTEHNMSPYQLFTSGSLRVQRAGLCALNFLLWMPHNMVHMMILVNVMNTEFMVLQTASISENLLYHSYVLQSTQ